MNTVPNTGEKIRFKGHLWIVRFCFLSETNGYYLTLSRMERSGTKVCRSIHSNQLNHIVMLRIKNKKETIILTTSLLFSFTMASAGLAFMIAWLFALGAILFWFGVFYVMWKDK